MMDKLKTCIFLLTQAMQLISDLGGVLGLWLGLAIFSTFEIAEFVVDILVLNVIKRLQGQPPAFNVTPKLAKRRY
jgi:hypothetical protein